jgi:hypothetical protein
MDLALKGEQLLVASPLFNFAWRRGRPEDSAAVVGDCQPDGRLLAGALGGNTAGSNVITSPAARLVSASRSVPDPESAELVTVTLRWAFGEIAAATR